MKLIRKLGERLSGKYKRRERKLTPVAADAIEAGLGSGAFRDPRVADYLRSWLPFLRNQKRAGDLTFFVGSKMARKILGLRKDEVEAPALEFYRKLQPWFDEAAGCFDFDGIRLAPAANDREAEIFSAVFCDIFLAHLLGDDWLHVASGISSEGLYEHGGGVRLEEGDVVFDCGANMGMFAALAAKKGCRALAFEPSSYIRDAYTDRNASLNGGFEVYPYALSERRETLRFFLDRDNIGSSMRADAAGVAPRPEDIETVEALAIDDFVEQHGLDRVDFIKADIEGSERLMLRGARRVLREFSPKLSICTYHLPDDPDVLAKIILESQPRYTIVQGDFKLYAHI